MGKPALQAAFEATLDRANSNIYSAVDIAQAGDAKAASKALKQARKLLAAAEAILEAADAFKFVKGKE